MRPLAAWSLCLALAGCASAAPATRLPAQTDTTTQAPAAAIRAVAVPLTGGPSDYDALIERIGNARVVLLGESTHGTHEFYRERARITQRLIQEKGFSGVAIEGDWPRAQRVNRYVRGVGTDRNAEAALGGFSEFPVWMWRNADVRDLVEWLRAHNQRSETPAGFYGLDVYSLDPSAEAVLAYLGRTDPEVMRRARGRYRCFDRFRGDGQAYGQAVEFGSARSCEQQAVEQFTEMERIGRHADPEFFDALQNARVVRGAEQYYRTMFRGQVESWNLRDRHMAETLEALLQHLDRPGQRSKLVVWAHNSHVGDARATHMGDQGELNIGQLARQRYGDEAVLVGFTTHTGTVTAASEWGSPPQTKRVRPSLPGSHESVLHAVGLPSFLVILDGGPATEALRGPRLERAIGVIYLPQSERVSHYFHADLAQQFDALIHWDETRAVQPLGTFVAATRLPSRPLQP